MPTDPPPLHSTTNEIMPTTDPPPLYSTTNIIFRPETYIGSVERHKEKLWIWQNEHMHKKKIIFLPGLYKIFDQILVNAANKQRDPTMNTVKVNIDVAENLISVWNNGDCIPSQHDILSQYCDKLGPLVQLSPLTKITIESADVNLRRLYKLVFTRNGPSLIIQPHVDGIHENWTMVSFKPDLAKLGIKRLGDGFVSLMKRRVVDIAGCLNGVNVELDGALLQLDTFEDYVKLYLGTLAHPLSIYEQLSDRLEICVVIADGHHFEQASFVNNIATLKGGSHVDYITGQVTYFLGKVVNLNPDYIKSHLWVFVNALIDNPDFDSETKENLTSNKASLGSTCKLTPEFLKRTANLDVLNKLVSCAYLEQNEELEKIDCKGEWKLNIPQLQDAYFAATAYSEDCTLILTHGSSAKAFAMSGLSFVSKNYYGVFPLSLSVWEASSEELHKNTEFQNITKILGLEHGKIYESVQELRYGHLILMADQDHDGSLFKGLLINFLHSFWPSLLKVTKFMLEFVPPIVRASNKETQEVFKFYTMPEYEAWKKKLGNKVTQYKIKYRKGLGTSETEEVKEYFDDLDNYTKEFVWADDEDGDAIEVAFNKMKIEERHQHWLRAHQTGDSKEKRIRYREFISKELILFSNQLSIPSILDGLNLCQRKVLFCAFKKPITEEIEVSQFSGYVSVMSAYHDDEASIVSTIIGMAQNYVGSNNINLLEPKGLFGTRLMGGEDHASGEVIFTQLSHIARCIFHEADELLLNYLDDDGQSIEPAWFLPIIPMVLVNGSEDAGTGWSSFIPNYNPRDIIANLRRLLKGKAMVQMTPWYKGFTGSITKKQGASNDYITTGKFVERKGEEIKAIEDPNVRVSITELPVRRWTHEYKEILHAARQDGKDKTPSIKDYTAHNTDKTVHFKILMTKDQMKTAEKEGGFAKKFALTTTISTAHMYLFDANGVIKKYDTPEQILKEFFDHRLQFYEKRRKAQLDELNKASKLLKNKELYIRAVCGGTINLARKNRGDLFAELQKNGFDEVSTAEDKVAAGQGGTGFDYLLSTHHASFTYAKAEELLQERHAKEEEIRKLSEATWKSLWQTDLDVLDYELERDGYPSPPFEIEEEAPKKKAPAKRAPASPLPQRANKKRLEQ